MAKAKITGLRIRKVADKSTGQRVRGYDSRTGEPCLINPETERPEPWPLAGITFEGAAPPAATVLSTSFVARGQAEGWLELVNPRVVHRPGGPPEDRWRVTHTFTHVEAIVFKALEENVRYRVTHQPDKYVDGRPDTARVTDEIYAAGDTRVDWFYTVELVRE